MHTGHFRAVFDYFLAGSTGRNALDSAAACFGDGRIT